MTRLIVVAPSVTSKLLVSQVASGLRSNATANARKLMSASDGTSVGSRASTCEVGNTAVTSIQ